MGGLQTATNFFCHCRCLRWCNTLFSAVIYFLQPSQSRVAPELRCRSIPRQITSISQTHYQTSKHIFRIKSIATTHTNTDVNETNKILISATLEVYREHGKVVIEGFSQEKNYKCGLATSAKSYYCQVNYFFLYRTYFIRLVLISVQQGDERSYIQKVGADKPWPSSNTPEDRTPHVCFTLSD